MLSAAEASDAAAYLPGPSTQADEESRPHYAAASAPSASAQLAPPAPTRCQYVSALFLQCKNQLNASAIAAAAAAANANNNKHAHTAPTLTDSSPLYCDKHNAFIETVKSRANVTRAALDPDFRVKTHLAHNDDHLSATLNSSQPAHVFEPSVSNAWAFDDDNPLRNADVITDKEAVRQYEAAIDRMLEKVEDCRKLLYYRFLEHLKSRPKVLSEKRKYKLVVKNKEDRTKMQRLRADAKYGRYNRESAAFLDKCYRKHQLEIVERDADWKPREHIRDWLETPEQRCGTMRCSIVERVANPKVRRVEYESPAQAASADEAAVVDAILDAVCECVSARFEDVYVDQQCSGNRLPMTDFCAQHITRDQQARLFVPCKECGAPCLAIDKSLCRKHARTSYVPAPAPQPQSRDRVSAPVKSAQRLPTTRNINGWLVHPSHSQHLTHVQFASNGVGGAHMIDPRTGAHAQVVRRPRVPTRPLTDDERLPDGVFMVDQNDSTGANGTPSIHTIDEDQPMDDFKKTCELQRECLAARVDMPPRAAANMPMPPQTLRVNGYTGSLMTRAPLVVHSGGASVDANGRKLTWTQSMTPRPNSTPRLTSTPTPAQVLPGSARTRPFMGRKEASSHGDTPGTHLPGTGLPNGKHTLLHPRKTMIVSQTQKAVARRPGYPFSAHPSHFIRQSLAGNGPMYAHTPMTVSSGSRIIRRVTPTHR